MSFFFTLIHRASAENLLNEDAAAEASKEGKARGHMEATIATNNGVFFKSVCIFIAHTRVRLSRIDYQRYVYFPSRKMQKKK